MKQLYHLGFPELPEAEYAILPGDPGRVEAIARNMENARFFSQNREYTTWIGEIEGRRVLVMSTGMGGPSTAIAVEELAQVGVRTLVRIGTCGGMAERVCGGDIVVASAAIRAEGTTREYVPLEFPAVADLDVTNALVAAAREAKANVHVGVVHCKDSFYGQHEPGRMPIGYELENKWAAWIGAGCLASEMESASLFVVSQTLGLRAGCVLAAVWNQERRKLGLEDRDAFDTTAAVEIAIEAVRKLIQNEGESAV